MDAQVAGSLELLRSVYERGLVRSGKPPTTGELVNLERELGVTLPAEYKDLLLALGFVCVGDPPVLVIYGVAPADHGGPCEVDVVRARTARTDGLVPLIRLVTDGREKIYALDGHSRLHVVVVAGDEQRVTPVEPAFLACLRDALTSTVEARIKSTLEAAGTAQSLLDFDVPGQGQATLQMHAVPRAVATALKKEPAVADEITLYTSLAEFRGQTVKWEKYQRDSDPPERKEMIRRMRSLLNQPGVSKLKELVGESVDLICWPDAIVACFGEDAIESLALRGTVELPSDGTDTIHMLPVADVKKVAAVIADSETRLRARYRADVLRARGLYNTDSPNEAAFLEELCMMWSAVVDAIEEAAASGCGWLIRRTEG